MPTLCCMQRQISPVMRELATDLSSVAPGEVFFQEVKRQLQVACAFSTQCKCPLVLETLMSHPKDHLECCSLPALSFKTADGHVSASPRSKQVQHDAAFVVHTLRIACLVFGHCCSYAACLDVGFSSLTSNI